MSNRPVKPSTVAKLELKSIINTNRYSLEMAKTFVCGVTRYFFEIFVGGFEWMSPALVGVGDRTCGEVCGPYSFGGCHRLLDG